MKVIATMKPEGVKSGKHKSKKPDQANVDIMLQTTNKTEKDERLVQINKASMAVQGLHELDKGKRG